MVCARAAAVWGVPLVVVEDREDPEVACGFDYTRTFPRASGEDEYPRSEKIDGPRHRRREFFTALSPQEPQIQPLPVAPCGCWAAKIENPKSCCPGLPQLNDNFLFVSGQDTPHTSLI